MDTNLYLGLPETIESLPDSNEQLIIKPFLTDSMAGELLKKLYGMEASHTKELPSFCDQNFHVGVTGAGGAEDGVREFVLRLSNTNDSLHQRGCYDDIIGVLRYLQQAGALGMYPAPVMNLQGEYLSLQTFYRTKDKTHGVFLVMLVTFIQGGILSEVAPLSNQLLYNVGKALGRLNATLMGYKGATSNLKARAADNRFCMTSAGNVKQYVCREALQSRRNLANTILDRFIKDVKPLEYDMQKGVIHADANRANILISEPTNHSDAIPDIGQSRSPVISGIIDFNDMSYECLVYDIAGSVVDMMVGRKDDQPLEGAGHFLAGFTSVVPLSPTEWNSLYVSIATRFVQLLIMSYDEYCQQIDQPDEYILRFVHAGGWDVLRELWETPQQQVEAIWERIIQVYNNN
ncbi:hydroxylysine kinase-like [Asterias rubens]|uniref:hydroxylysine kinase-like n=1 Tax=Asterias rubens TaxID=7604 RepID=UPI001455CC57|nr:hydroxylysine kinase-like [Asterias rubens]